MFFNFIRGMFRLNGNNLMLLFLFFIGGLLLHFKGETKPVADLWRHLKAVIQEEPARSSHLPSPDLQSTQNKSESVPDEPNDEPADTDQTEDRLTRLVSRADFILPATNRKDQIVKHKGFSLNYAEQYEQAAWVAYLLTREQVTGQSARSKLFLPDPKVKTGSAIFADYTRSGYDRGHLAPAADFKHDYAMMEETFYMSNISPQNRAFNAGIWNDLEKLVRSWAQRYEKIYVVTGPVLKRGLPTIGRLNKIAVPEDFYKVVLYVDPPQVRGIAFVIPNQPSTQPLSSFVVNIATVEKLTGIDFFPLLPDAIEKQVEAVSYPKDWYRLR